MQSFRLMSGNSRAYVVQKGDCLSLIGQKLKEDWRELAKRNRIKSPYVIYPGQMIIL